MRGFILTLIISASALCATAQPLNRATYATMIRIAEEKMAEHDYYNAMDWYEKSYEEQKDYDVAIKLGELNLMLRDYKKAARWYQRALRRDKKDNYAEHRFNYARCLKMDGQYDEAIAEFEKYMKTTTDPVKKELSEMEVKGAEFAKIAQEINGVTISNAGRNVNTKYSEYSAYLRPDGKEMLYASIQSDEVIVVDEKTEGYYAQIMSSKRTDEGWGEPKPLSEKINRPGYHTGNVTLSPNGRRMYFSRMVLGGNIINESKIHVSDAKGKSWSSPKEVQGINGDWLAMHPAVGELFGNEVIFFVSDMDGGEGGLDIYYATYKGDGVYGDPVNLGPKINTVGDEVTPFYRDGLLYFSSTGHPGLGGFDIFSTEWDGSRWSEPANMGKGFNTSVDDKYFMLDQEGYSGFLLSNRSGTRSVKSKTCCDDIWNVSLKEILANMLATVYDAESKEALAGAKVELYELTDNDPVSIGSKNNKDGNDFPFGLELDKEYMVIATRDDYFADTTTFHTVGLLDSKTFDPKLYLDPAPVYIEVVRNEAIELENIYYDFNDDKILEDAEPDLSFVKELMDEYPDMVIELSSHTDARGEDAYNRNLSQRRAESARKWLLDKGVDRKRIKAVGYGETEPKTITAKLAERHDFANEGDVLTEEFIEALEGEETQEAAHQINRRTEFKIIAGPTSIRFEEKRLIRRGLKELEGDGELIEETKSGATDGEKKN